MVDVRAGSGQPILRSYSSVNDVCGEYSVCFVRVDLSESVPF